MPSIYNENSSNVSKELKIIKPGRSHKRSILKRILKYVSIITWIRSYNFSMFKNDLLSGFIMSVVVIPQCLAFSHIAGIPPKYAFYTAIVIPIVTLFFSSSMFMINGPSIALSMVAFSIVSNFAKPFTDSYIELMLLLSFFVGIFQLALFFLKFNFLLKFISTSVIKAFTASAATLIILHELAPILGIHGGDSGATIDIVLYLFTHVVSNINYWSLLLGASTIGIWYILNLKINGGIAIFLSILISSSLGYVISHYMGAYIRFEHPVETVIPHFHLPTFKLEQALLIYKDAFVLAIIALVLATSIATSLAEQTKTSISMRQEIISQGMTNLIGGFFSTYISTGSFSRSALNYDCAGKSPIAGLISSIFTILIVMFFGSIVQYIPSAVIAGIVFLIGLRLIHFKSFIKIIKFSRTERYILMITFLTGILVSLQMAIYMGVLSSVIIFILRVSAPRIFSIKYKHTTKTFTNTNVKDANNKDGECPQIVMIKIQGAIYFGSSRYMAKALSEIVKRNKQKIFLLISGEGITTLDWDGAHILEEKAQKWGERMCITGLAPNIKGTLKRYNINHKRLRFKNKTVAITYLLDKIDLNICKNCDRTVFQQKSLENQQYL